MNVLGSSTFYIGRLEKGESSRVYPEIYVSPTITASTTTVKVSLVYFDEGLGIVKTEDRTLSLFLRASTWLAFCQFPGKSAAPGDSVEFQIRLKNPLEVQTRFKISLDSVPSNWTASVKTTDGDYVTEAILGSNEYADLVVEVDSPNTATIGEEYQLLIRVRAYDGSVTDSLPLSISLMNVAVSKASQKMAVTFPEITVQAGESLQYPITIINPTDAAKSLLLYLQRPTDWTVVFKSEGGGVKALSHSWRISGLDSRGNSSQHS